ncbi:guanitoxin biosynthesis MBL fold metallo-hydrolase GntH [Bradyrhizobium brasilense]|uniref:guanitoxin biosynthesis MBL fold metallo-hydrolase GntH n=1 Tax=Bradyrhizobium brasilense TaxID=1419277 RepID=UPI0024B21346|nr:guanitoxin biosynthesis MBL fold metallo-hydrolase GntH [Bradyrhizobium australafricanum]WFU36134.1 guanitoxin biosynthesis MBL fold metallo-hydrolase GntH [Bradyrhizobium australafricanum]
MKNATLNRLAAAFFGISLCATAVAPEAMAQNRQASPIYETDPQVLKELATGGQPMGRWKEGLTFDGVAPMPWLKSATNWFPNTEEVQPDEIRVTFMGSSPLPRPGQMGTSVYVELGNGHNFIFDMGPGSVANYLAAGVPLNRINDIFLTHLHWDHVDSVAYIYMFGAWGGRWHETFRITGPSGPKPELGTRYMMDRMKEMLTWHRNNFDASPIGQGFDMEVKEFDFRDDGGVAYEKDGIKITHWRQSHVSDGASAYRLDWNGMCVAFTGDGRPNSLTIKYAKGCDVVITEVQAELISITATVNGVMPVINRTTMDQAHNSAYAAGYLFSELKPRMAMTTHMSFDPFANLEMYAEIREQWKGPFHFGAPDLVVVNLTRDKVWVRDGVVAKYPNIASPKFDIEAMGGLVIPAPRNTRPEIQEQSIRDAQIPPDDYYPQGYKPELIEAWPTTKPVFIPKEQVPPGMWLRGKPNP